MKKKWKFLTIILLVMIILTRSTILEKEKPETIDEILSNEYYSYLSENAKEYIKESYNETGQLILTEKNKKENEPYLNPEFDKYISLTSVEQKEYDVIPDDLIVDYVDDIKKDSSTYESYYNLSSLDTNNDGIADSNYTTPMKNQADLGICWAMTISENAETLMMLNKKETYAEGKTTVLSPRQLDYATSINGIINYNNEYGTRNLAEGNSFTKGTPILAEGPSMFSASWPYTLSLSRNKLKYNEVFDSSKSLAEINTTIEMPVLNIKNLDLSQTQNSQRANNYINELKRLIKTYGGPYVGTYAPGYSCSAINSIDNTTSIIDVDSTCMRDGSHAMQVIGWNDNYEYKYCKNGTNHAQWTSSCSSSNTVTGKGAWILRNSWGEDSYYKYAYLSYDSSESYFGFITNLNTNKKWNMTYSSTKKNIEVSKKNVTDSNSLIWTRLTVSPKTDININSKLVKIKFKTPIQNATYKVYVSTSGSESDFELVYNQKVAYPGYVTVDLSNKNYIINKNSKVYIDSSTSSIKTDFVALLTKETTANQHVTTKDVVYVEDENKKVNNLYMVNVVSDTYNIPSGTVLNYEIYNSAGTNITSSLKVENNIVGNNKVNTTLYVPKLSESYYTVKIKLNGVLKSEFKMRTAHKPSIGKGTETDPYVIMTPEDLHSINYFMNSHFVIGKDIDMTYDTQDTNGLYYNGGKGWKPIGIDNNESFNGSLNGMYNGTIHTIKGMLISEGGLFYKLIGNESSISIKNIIFKDAKINNANLVTGQVMAETKNVTIENIGVIDSQFNESRIIGKEIYSYIENGIRINGLYTDSLFNNYSTNGIISYANASLDFNDPKASMEISNIEFLGKITSTQQKPTLFAMAQGNTTIKNIIFNNNTNIDPILVHVFYESTYNPAYVPTIKDVYVLGTVYLTSQSTEEGAYKQENVVIQSINDLVKPSIYTEWSNFNENWKTNLIDGKYRIPTLKFIPFEFTNINDFNITTGSTIDIFDYIEPNNYAQYIQINTTNTDIINISGSNIKGLRSGEATLHVTSLYDGLDKDVKITVSNEKTTIYFEDSTDSSKKKNILVNKGENTTLPANTFTKVGYKFKNWNTKKDGTGISYSDRGVIKVSVNTTLYAQWEKIKYKVKYNSNNTYNFTKEQEARYDERITLLSSREVPAKEKRTFVEWNTKRDGTGTAYNDQASVMNLTATDNDIVNLYAIWNPPTLIVSFNKTTGEGTMNDAYTNSDGSITLPENKFTKTGYTFTSWNTKQDGTGISYANKVTIVNLTDDIVLYAQYSPIKYTIRYDKTTGTGTMTDSTNIEYDKEFILKKNTYTKTGYLFGGWNTKADGTGVYFNDEAAVINLSKTNSVVTLYATWVNETEIENAFADYTGYYDGKEHGMVVRTSTQGLNIKYTYNGREYNEMPKFKNPGEYTVSYKITMNDDSTKTGTKKIKIYGISNLSSKIRNINENLIFEEKSFRKLTEGLTVYATTRNYTHYDKNHTEVARDEIKTGDILKLTLNDEKEYEYEIAYLGDVNGNGTIEIIDYIRIMKDITNDSKLSGIYKYAADMNKNNSIDIIDYIRIMRIIMEGNK